MQHQHHHTGDNNVRPEHINTGFQQQGDHYQFREWTYNIGPKDPPGKGYNDCLCFVLVHKGTFSFNLGPASFEMHSGQIVIDKPGYSYTLHASSGACTVFNFTEELYASLNEEFRLHKSSFFSNADKLAQLLQATPEIDYLHYQLLQNKNTGAMERDVLVAALLRRVMEGATGESMDIPGLETIRKSHLSTIERAREYLQANFLQDLSLAQLSRHCCVSPFYLSRLFKTHAGVPPYKYLQEVRLQHAILLLLNTSLPITEVCYSSGFQNPDYFTAAFTKRFGVAPSRYKQSIR